MKIAYISPCKNSTTYVNLKKEANIAGIEIQPIKYSQFKPNTIKNFNFFILRDPSSKVKDYSKEMRRILKKLNKNNTLDFNTLNSYPNYEDKLFQHRFFKNLVQIPKTYYFKNKIKINSFPIIIKERIGSRGRQDFILDSEKQLHNFLKNKKIQDYIIETYIQTKRDLRILVLNNKILTAVERKPWTKKHRNYTQVGVRVSHKCKLNQNLRKKALSIAKKIKADFCGIDFIIDKNNKPYFLECNVSPQFIATQKISKVKVSRKLLNFIKTTHKNFL